MKELISIIDTEDNRNILVDIIRQCRKDTINTREERKARVISPSKNMLNVVIHMLAEMIRTGKNFFTRTNSDLKELSEYATVNDLKKNMTKLFVDNGIGDFVSTGRTSHIVYAIEDEDGNRSQRTMPEAIFSMYFNKTFLDRLESKTFLSGKLKYDTLVDQINTSKRLLDRIANSTKTRISLTKTVNGSVTIDESILIEKDFNNAAGTYTKTSITNVKDVNGNITSSVIEETKNNFRPKRKDTGRLSNREQGKGEHRKPRDLNKGSFNSNRISKFNRGPVNTNDEYEGEEGEMI